MKGEEKAVEKDSGKKQATLPFGMLPKKSKPKPAAADSQVETQLETQTEIQDETQLETQQLETQDETQKTLNDDDVAMADSPLEETQSLDEVSLPA